jgi:hypothetical protein
MSSKSGYTYADSFQDDEDLCRVLGAIQLVRSTTHSSPPVGISGTITNMISPQPVGDPLPSLRYQHAEAPPAVLRPVRGEDLVPMTCQPGKDSPIKPTTAAYSYNN